MGDFLVQLGNLSLHQTETICYFYKKGSCRYGNRCRNSHIRSYPASSSLKSESMPTGVGKECGICFDIVMEKTNPREQAFGILPNCNHCFCFSCIKKWRQSKEFDSDVSKSCPECRTPSNYVYVSSTWFEVKADKDKFIRERNARMQSIPCRFFKHGKGTCIFGDTCLYQHALPNGKKIYTGRPRQRNRQSNLINLDEIYRSISGSFQFPNDSDSDDFDSDGSLDYATIHSDHSFGSSIEDRLELIN